MNIKIKALLALLGTVLFFSILVIVARAYVVSISPMFLLFLRVLVAAIAFSPFLIKSRVWKKPKIKTLMAVSLLSTVNLVFFIWGIQYTSASASQLIYTIQPILNILVSNYLLKEKYPARTYVGVIIGLIGIVLIIYLSAVEKGETISGGIIGNIAIMIAMLGWFWYIMLSKKLSKYFSPIEISSVSIFVSLFVSIVLLITQLILTSSPIHLTTQAIMAGLYMGFFGTFLTYILMQYAIKHLSTLTVNLSSYIQPVVVMVLAIILLGEKMTIGFLVGSFFVLLGVFITGTIEAYKRRN